MPPKAIAGAATHREPRVPQRPRLPRADGADERHRATCARDGVDIWVGTQAPTRTTLDVAKALGTTPDKVRVHQQFLGGGFGRRATVEASVDAALIVEGGEPAGEADPQPRGRSVGGHLPPDDLAAHRSRARRGRQDRRLAPPRGRRAGGRFRLPPGLQQGGEGPRHHLHDGRGAAVLQQGRPLALRAPDGARAHARRRVARHRRRATPSSRSNR